MAETKEQRQAEAVRFLKALFAAMDDNLLYESVGDDTFQPSAVSDARALIKRLTKLGVHAN
jgi:hypothetical protein